MCLLETRPVLDSSGWHLTSRIHDFTIRLHLLVTLCKLLSLNLSFSLHRSKVVFRMGSAVDEFEEFNPCFFENSTEEQFYDAPAPSEDIWKKFELLPTPPRSPKHEPFYQSLNVPSTLEKLQLVSDILDDPMSKTVVFPPEECTFQIKCKDTCCNLNINSKLIQDCMWSGHNIFGTTNRESTQTTRSTNLSSNIDINAPTECVDPTAVFPYPVNGLTTRVHREQPSRSLGTDTPSDSGLSASGKCSVFSFQ